MPTVWRGNYVDEDPDAAAYLDLVEAADGQSLESATRTAVNTFVEGCKSDGIWDAIKASCILAGARTLDGALVPLVGTAPTNFNSVSGDYNRTTGLIGDGSTKYLDSNRNNNAEPQDNQHFSWYSPDYNNSSPSVSSDESGATSGMSLLTKGNVRSRSAINTLFTGTSPFVGMSRSSAPTVDIRYNGSTVTYNRTSAAPTSSPILVYRLTNSSGFDVYSASRQSFYSIGESLDLALLEARVSTLMTDLAAAIP